MGIFFRQVCEACHNEKSPIVKVPATIYGDFSWVTRKIRVCVDCYARIKNGESNTVLR